MYTKVLTEGDIYIFIVIYIIVMFIFILEFLVNTRVKHKNLYILLKYCK